jgi:hypothetical protein
MKNFINIIKGDFMKRQVRLNVFETNSSMTHSLTMCTDSEYKMWQNGELYLHRWEDYFVSAKKVDNKLKKDWEENKEEYDSYEDFLKENEYYTYNSFWQNEWLETFDEKYTTPNGEIIHAFGLYGHD